MGGLTAKQEAFCLEYLKDLNATQAAIRAGYSENTAQEQSSRLLSNVMVSEKIAELKESRNKATEMNAQYVLNRLKEIDELDVLDILEDDLSSFKKLSLWPKAWRISISGIDMKRIVQSDGDNVIESVIEKIKWPDKTKNLEMIGRHVTVKAWEKEQRNNNITNNIMPVPTADSIDSWELAAKAQQEAILNGE